MDQKFFNSFSGLDYGWWDSSDTESLQIRFLKHILGVNCSTPNDLVRGELGIFPIMTLIDEKCVTFYKYLLSSDNEILKFSLNSDKELHKNGVSNSFTGYIKRSEQNISSSDIFHYKIQ